MIFSIITELFDYLKETASKEPRPPVEMEIKAESIPTDLIDESFKQIARYIEINPISDVPYKSITILFSESPTNMAFSDSERPCEEENLVISLPLPKEQADKVIEKACLEKLNFYFQFKLFPRTNPQIFDLISFYYEEVSSEPWQGQVLN